ncbi:MAG: hypothetical protein ACRCXZ_01450 [Patescibacteria group bacterium]
MSRVNSTGIKSAPSTSTSVGRSSYSSPSRGVSAGRSSGGSSSGG